MLTTDLVRVIRRSGRLHVPMPRPAQRSRLVELATTYTQLAREHVGRTRAELTGALDAVAHEAADFKASRGLRKLVEDRCTFEPCADLDPPVLRRELFSEAASARRSVPGDGTFSRRAVLESVASRLGIGVDDIEAGLYADLRENHRLREFERIDGPALVDAYERALVQAVLLRALRVRVKLSCADPSGYRTFLRKLKFHRLLFTVQRLDDGSHLIVIDGPFSIMKAVTKYGLKLALLVPLLERSGTWELDADVLWDRDREPLLYHLEGKQTARGSAGRLPDEVRKLLTGFGKLDSPWRAEVAHEILDLPGVGVCVPDLVFTHAQTGSRAYLEVLGFWSRDAVWQRVDLVREGLSHPIIFAVSSRLRVSEEVLPADLPGQLYVYKGVMRPSAILERLQALVPAAGS